MPKMKTNKSVKKRFKITKKGKVLRTKCKRRHLLTDKDAGKKRGLRGMAVVDGTDEHRIKELAPYGI